MTSALSAACAPLWIDAQDIFSWDRHVGRLVEAADLYGFWTELFSRDKEVQLNYVDAIHYLLLLPKIKESA